MELFSEFIFRFLYSFWEMLVLSGPWLLVGLFAAGLIHECLSSKFVAKQISKPGLKSVLKSSALGLPLPLCSCSVIPVGISLRRAGASRGATSSFFVSTPEIGVDSFLLSYVLLGPLLAFSRAIASFVSAVIAGLSVDLLVKEEASDETSSGETPSCCAASAGLGEEKSRRSVGMVLTRAFRFGFVELLDDFSKLLLLGFLVAALISAAFPPGLFESLALSPLAYSFIMLFVSLPVYVCSVASTPVAAALLAKGIPAGAVLVFLLAGPATNITTMLVLRKELGSKALFLYVLSVTAVALGLASLIDYGPLAGYLPELKDAATAGMGHEHLSLLAQGLSWQGVLAQGFAIILLGLIAHSLYRQRNISSESASC